MRNTLVLIGLLIAPLAYAGPRHVLVLRSEGTASPAILSTIDTHVLRLAKNIDGNVEAGEITLNDAAAAVGCNTAEAACRDDVLATMGVDELVATTVTATASGVTVTVRRITSGRKPRVAQTTLASATSADAKINADLGPMFGAGIATTPLADGRVAPAASDPTPPPREPVADPIVPPVTSESVTAAPTGAIEPAAMPAEGGQRSQRLPKIGMATGGGLVLFGFILWGKAGSVQDEIDNSAVRTPGDFRRLQDLEGDADAYAGAGNLMFLTGAVLGGVSAYYYLKGRRASRARTARIAPAVFPSGAGVTLTIGGAP